MSVNAFIWLMTRQVTPIGWKKISIYKEYH